MNLASKDMNMVFKSLLLLFFTSLMMGCATTPTPEVNPVETDASTPMEVSTELDVKNNYLLDQGDVIAIQVFDEPDLTMKSQIGASGVINYSYLGNIVVRGKSPAELENHLKKLFENGYLVNPSINVTVVRYRPFYINGEVGVPGSYSYEPGLTVDRAITLAGGFTDRASKRKITITRIAEDGSTQKRKANLSDEVKPLDTINVDEGFF